MYLDSAVFIVFRIKSVSESIDISALYTNITVAIEFLIRAFLATLSINSMFGVHFYQSS